MKGRNKDTGSLIVAELVRIAGTLPVEDCDRDANGRLAWESGGTGGDGIKVDWDSAEQARDEDDDRLFVDRDGEIVAENDIELFNPDEPDNTTCGAAFGEVLCSRRRSHDWLHEGTDTKGRTVCWGYRREAADDCRDCGKPMDLEGYDGRCGNCADLHERYRG